MSCYFYSPLSWFIFCVAFIKTTLLRFSNVWKLQFFFAFEFRSSKMARFFSNLAFCLFTYCNIVICHVSVTMYSEFMWNKFAMVCLSLSVCHELYVFISSYQFKTAVDGKEMIIPMLFLAPLLRLSKRSDERPEMTFCFCLYSAMLAALLPIFLR